MLEAILAEELPLKRILLTNTAEQVDQDLQIVHEVDFHEFEKEEFHYWRALSLLSTFLEMEESGEFAEWTKELINK